MTNCSESLAKLRALPIVAEALKLLRDKLPKHLRYHIAEHTDDVLKEAITFALADGLSERPLELLAIGAAYHDLGFIETEVDNEAIGARLAVEAMRRFGGYSEREIEIVGQMIHATKVIVDERGPHHRPLNQVSKYLIDADVSNFGRDDFLSKADLVREESGMKDRRSFFQSLLKFLENHQWYSDAALRTRSGKKMENVATLQRMLAENKI